MSAYDQTSARTSEFGVVYEEEMAHGTGGKRRTQPQIPACGNASHWPYAHDPGARPGSSSNPRRHRAAYAAFDAFAPEQVPQTAHAGAGSRGRFPTAPHPEEALLDQRQVFSAARHGRHKEVEAALDAGFDPGLVDAYGNTLFHVACQNGNKRIAKLAIKYGGDMDAQSFKGHTGLHFLFAYGYPDIGEYFIGKGANDQIQNEIGLTARQGIR